MTGVISLDDLSSSKDGSGNDSETNSGSNSTDELREVCEEIGADYESAQEYVEQNGAKEKLVNFAQKVDDELMQVMEEYRSMNDLHRIVAVHLRGMDADFDAWTGQFYGNSDDPEPETYNYVQQKARDSGGNLAFYKALFPEPQAEYWPGEAAVLWQERPDEDSHIYVTKEFAEEYGEFARVINGTERPVPPSNSDVQSSDSGRSGLAFDPAEKTVEEVEDAIEDCTVDELEAILDAELADENRKTAKEAIKTEIGKRDSRDEVTDNGGSGETKTVTINGNEVTGSPEEIAEIVDML